MRPDCSLRETLEASREHLGGIFPDSLSQRGSCNSKHQWLRSIEMLGALQGVGEKEALRGPGRPVPTSISEGAGLPKYNLNEPILMWWDRVPVSFSSAILPLRIYMLVTH